MNLRKGTFTVKFVYFLQNQRIFVALNAACTIREFNTPYLLFHVGLPNNNPRHIALCYMLFEMFFVSFCIKTIVVKKVALLSESIINIRDQF